MSTLTELLAAFAGLAVLNVPLVAGISNALEIPRHLRFLVAVVTGLLLAFLLAASGLDLVTGLPWPAVFLGGLGVGIGSTGVHSGTKNLAGK